MPGPIDRTRIACVTAAVVVGLTSPAAREAQNLSEDRLVDRGLEYVAAYQKAFAFLLADEVTVQRIVERGRDPSARELASRTTTGEVFITFLDRRRHWTIVRDVATVDGLPAPRREDLATLIATEDTDTLARRLFALNARYNIGAVVRNFNDPMLALLALNSFHEPRFSFDLARVADRSDPSTPLATLRFRERERPTLVRQVSGAPVYARGEITLEAATGAVRRAIVTFETEGVDAELTTEFGWEERLGLWVPQVFTEHYAADREPNRTTIVESRYSNYRRFEVKGTLRPIAPVQ